MNRIFAIGDIHGCCKTFKKLLLEKIHIRKSDKIYCIGDYIDRGKDSKGVIDFILSLRLNGFQIHTLRGNHEQMMLDAPINDKKLNYWLKYGGTETLQSFSVTSINEIQPKYISFLKRTKFYIKTKNYIFVHAGLNFFDDNIFEDKESMLWLRDYSENEPLLQNRILIHGHTPEPLDFIINQTGNMINIDAGCVYNTNKELGKMVAIDLLEKKFIFVNNCD